jgi:hypothetical protein
MQSNMSDTCIQDKFPSTPELDESKRYYGGVVPWFASPFSYGTPTGYIPIHFGSPIVIPDQRRFTTEPGCGPLHNVSGIRGPEFSEEFTREPKHDLSDELVESIGSMEADESNIDDLIYDTFDAESLSE